MYVCATHHASTPKLFLLLLLNTVGFENFSVSESITTIYYFIENVAFLYIVYS